MNILNLLTRLLLCFTISASLCTACNNKPDKGSVSASATDSVLNTETGMADSTLSEEDEELSTAVDENFDDFIYSFMKEKRFQIGRIKFPLAQTENGKTTFVQRNAWKYDPLFAEDDSYTMLFNDETSLEHRNDTSLTEVCVEHIFMSEEKIKQLHFKKTNGRWKLTDIHIHHFNNDSNQEFLAFYSNFATDSVFQRQHTQNPLRFRTYDSDNYNNVDGLLDIEQWFAFRPEMPIRNFTNINYGINAPGSKQRLLIICSQSEGMNCILTFVKYGDTWRLTCFEN